MTMLISSSEPWRTKQRQSIVTALTTLPQGWVSAHSEGQPSWLCGQNICGHFVRAVLATNVEESDRAMAAKGMKKALVSPPSR